MTLLPVFLPQGYQTKIAVGDKVTAGSILAEKKITGKDEVIYIAKDLNISPKKVSQSLKKSLGSKISVGDIIAVKKGKLGIGKKQLISEFEGTLIKLEEETGNLYVRVSVKEEEEKEPLISPVDGIVDFCNNEKIVLKTEKAAIMVDKTNGKSAKGELLVLDKKEIEDEDIKKEVNERIVAGKDFELAAIFKIFAIGGLGVITINEDKKVESEILEKKLSKPFFLLSKENYEKIEKLKGKEIFLDSTNKSIITI